MGKPSLKVPSYADDLAKSSGKKTEASGSRGAEAREDRSKVSEKRDGVPSRTENKNQQEQAPPKKVTPPPPPPARGLVITEGNRPKTRPAEDPAAKSKGKVGGDPSPVPELQKVLGKRPRDEVGPVETGSVLPPPPPRVHHGFRYEYTKNEPFVNSEWDCAELFSRIKGPGGAFPNIKELRENQSYLNITRLQARLAAEINCLTARYDSRSKRLAEEREKANEGLRVSADNFDKLTKAMEAKNSEIATLAKELDRAGDAVRRADQEKAEMERKHRAEIEGYELRLKNQEEEHQKEKKVWEQRRLDYAQEMSREVADTTRAKVRAEYEARLTGYEARLGRVADYLNGKKKADEVVAKFAQVSGTLEVLKLIADQDQIQIPEVRMEQLRKDRASLEEQAQGMEIPDLLPGDVPGFDLEEDAGVSSMDVDVEPGELVAGEAREDPPE